MVWMKWKKFWLISQVAIRMLFDLPAFYENADEHGSKIYFQDLFKL